MTTTVQEPMIAEVPGPTRRTRWFRRFVVAGVTLALVAVGTWWYYRAKLQTYHFQPVVSGVLFRSGNRGMREFEHALRQSQARTVVSLVSDAEVADRSKPQFAAESLYCQHHGIRLVRIPVPMGGWPTGDQISHFLTVLNEPANQPVLIHCAQGVRRTGMFVAAYQMEIQEATRARAKAQVQSFGHRASDTDDVRRFIDGYDYMSNVVPATMPAGAGE